MSFSIRQKNINIKIAVSLWTISLFLPFVDHFEFTYDGFGFTVMMIHVTVTLPLNEHRHWLMIVPILYLTLHAIAFVLILVKSDVIKSSVLFVSVVSAAMCCGLITLSYLIGYVIDEIRIGYLVWLVSMLWITIATQWKSLSNPKLKTSD
ncbi:hypothetical protein [Rubinisphaera italica]|uniref:Uncharacterized protein n=1 Tax=Rubinisphaera italica TaxID=2527969 RepID=A0A5C5X8N6_9PLAN|nr:hypothetical protein [Rubinisphaera italica]TWT59366.1 hypothetical protein Pan54_00670 [Rubinisphaera italica]